MSATLPPEALAFLEELAEHNSREWFDANRARYERDLKGPARALVEALDEELARISPAHVTPVARALSRINRDTRFSADKRPYRTEIWAGFQDDRLPRGGGAGFYFGVSPLSVGVGAGLWLAPKELLPGLRAHIAAHAEELLAILGALAPSYGEAQGEKLKRVPKPWDDTHPAAELLKHKGLYLKAELDPGLATSPELVGTIAGHFAAMKPLVDFLDAGLRG